MAVDQRGINPAHHVFPFISQQGNRIREPRILKAFPDSRDVIPASWCCAGPYGGAASQASGRRCRYPYICRDFLSLTAVTVQVLIMYASAFPSKGTREGWAGGANQGHAEGGRWVCQLLLLLHHPLCPGTGTVAEPGSGTGREPGSAPGRLIPAPWPGFHIG